MSKLLLLVIALISYVYATPAPRNNNDNFFGPNFPFTNFPQMNIPQIKFPEIKMPEIKMPKMPEIKIPTIRPLTAQDIANMKPGPGVSGISQTITSRVEYVDGKPVTKTEGVMIVNQGGKVTETTFGN